MNWLSQDNVHFNSPLAGQCNMLSSVKGIPGISRHSIWKIGMVTGGSWDHMVLWFCLPERQGLCSMTWQNLLSDMFFLFKINYILEMGKRKKEKMKHRRVNDLNAAWNRTHSNQLGKYLLKVMGPTARPNQKESNHSTYRYGFMQKKLGAGVLTV